MNKINIIGSRFSIVLSTTDKFDEDWNESMSSKGYTYACITAVGPGNTKYFLRRDTGIHRGTLAELTEPEYTAVISVAASIVSVILSETRNKRMTHYYSSLETLINYSGDLGLIRAFYDSTVSAASLGSLLGSRLTPGKRIKGPSVTTQQGYVRYDIPALVEDLTKDGASLIMDDGLHKYRWHGRSSEGYGKIKPFIPEGELYPVYQVLGEQGNQTNANLSLKFALKVLYDTGNQVEVLSVNRNLMLVEDGKLFQDYLAVRTSQELKTRLEARGLVCSNLPGTLDYLIDLSKIPVSCRKSQGNQAGITKFLQDLCLYQVTKRELETMSGSIVLSPAEKTEMDNRSKASRLYWSLNQSDRVHTASGKKLYKVFRKSGVYHVPTGKSQDDLRVDIGKLKKLETTLHSRLTSTVYNYLCSKKSMREFFGLPKNLAVGKYNQRATVISPVTNQTYSYDVVLDV